MDSNRQPDHWLRYYGNTDHYRWRRTQDETTGTDTFCRPLGLAEFAFDGDGRYFEGRADMNCLLEVKINSKLSKNAFRERILIAWTRLRCWHSLLRARTLVKEGGKDVWFLVDVFKSVGRAIEAAGESLVFLQDHFGEKVDEKEFWMHCLNTGRVLDPEEALAKCFVHPVGEDGILRFQMVIAHQIADGLSAWVWMRDFVKVLNETEEQLREGIAECIDPEHLQRQLPLPQEALYPKIPGSLARQRWFWAITRILRHVRKQLPAGFENPLRRQKPAKIEPLPPKYSPVLDYSKLPNLNTFPPSVSIPASGLRCLQRLCKEAKATVGAGIYALAAVVVMEFQEKKIQQSGPSPETRTFISGFPLNPRAFFNHHSDPDSMMLAFCDGIALPFLPSHLDLAGRIRLLARQAQRQLATYQKRTKAKGQSTRFKEVVVPRRRHETTEPPANQTVQVQEASPLRKHCDALRRRPCAYLSFSTLGHDATRQNLTSRGAGLILANQYLWSVERASGISPTPAGPPKSIVQGEFPARTNPTVQTHGVSSVGNREGILRSGIYTLDDPDKDFVADFRDLTATVRAREGEFLLGIDGSSAGLSACPSVDGTNLDPVLIEQWRERFETILNEVDDEETARL